MGYKHNNIHQQYENVHDDKKLCVWIFIARYLPLFLSHTHTPFLDSQESSQPNEFQLSLTNRNNSWMLLTKLDRTPQSQQVLNFDSDLELPILFYWFRLCRIVSFCVFDLLFFQ